MTNDEARMTEEIRNPNDEKLKLVVRSSLFVRDQGFVISHSFTISTTASTSLPGYGFFASFKEAEFMQ